jgi:hypothetical protein
LTVFEVTSAPGMLTGWASEMIRTSPPSPSSIPSVVMNDETPITSQKKPLMSPITAQQARARIRLTTSGRPSSLNWKNISGANRKTDPIERSISPATISITSPAARIANGAK